MNNEEINALIVSLEEYPEHSKRMQDSNFSTKEVKTFKKHYNKTHLDLISYLKVTKDKKLSEQAKKLMLSEEIFKSTNKLIAILSIVIVISSILLINLYFTSAENWLMISITAIVGVLIFFLIRKVQSQPKSLVSDLEQNGREIKKVLNTLRSKLKE